MVARRIVNASPLILLSKLGRLDLVRLENLPILVPDAVVTEIGALGPEDDTIQAIRAAPWMRVVSTPPIPAEMESFRLGAGESSVLALALSLSDAEVVLDDLAARKCALHFGLPLQGTIGLLLQAKQLGAIPSLRSELERLRWLGMYLSNSLMRRALTLAGEEFA